jgi:hypothetical protein
MTLRSLVAALGFALAFGGVAMAMIAAVRRFGRWSARLDLERRRRSRTLLLSDAGVELHDMRWRKRRWFFAWSDVAEIVAFKRDSFTVDDVCVGFRPDGSDRMFVCDEDMPGWTDLNAELERRFGIVFEDWWRVVEPTAFAENWTVLWKR